MRIPGSHWLVGRLRSEADRLRAGDQAAGRSGTQIIPMSDVPKGQSLWSDDRPAVAADGPFGGAHSGGVIVQFGTEAGGYVPWSALPAWQWPMVVQDPDAPVSDKPFRQVIDAGEFGDALDPEYGWGGRHAGYLPDGRSWVLAVTLRA